MVSEIDIDLVCCWVKLDDDYESLLRKYKGENLWSPGSTQGRFRELGELKFSIPLALKNLPWLRKVFIVTNGQEIPYEIKSQKKVNVIYHNQFFKYIDHLPTFSYHSICPNLCFIKDLAEHFILTNDDIFITKPLNKEDFLGKSGIGKFSHTPQSFNKILPPKNMWQYNLQSTNNLLNKYYGEFDRKIFTHSPQLFIKSKCIELWNLFHDEIKNTSAQKFREKNNIIFRSLYPYFVIYENWGIHDYDDLVSISNGDVGYLKKHEYRTIPLMALGKGKWEDELSRFLESSPPTFLNLNDNIASVFYEKTSNKVRLFLEQLFKN